MPPECRTHERKRILRQGDGSSERRGGWAVRGRQVTLVNMSRIGVAAGVLALGIGALWVGGSGGRGEARAAEWTPPEVTPKPVAPLGDLEAPEEEMASEGRSEAGEGLIAEAGVTHDAAAAEDSGKVTLAGSATVRDEHGVEHANESGSIVLTLWKDGPYPLHEEVVVEDGRWSVELDPGTRIGVQKARLGDRTTVALEQNRRFGLPADLRLELYFHWPKRSVLYVRDARDHRELDDIELVLAAGWAASDQVHPGRFAPRQRVESSASSPIELSSLDAHWTQAMFARSPGYAWGRIEIANRLGGERILMLEPGGDARIELKKRPSTPLTNPCCDCAWRAPRLPRPRSSYGEKTTCCSRGWRPTPTARRSRSAIGGTPPTSWGPVSWRCASES